MSTMSRIEDGCKITPAASHKSSNTSLFNSLKRRDSKQSYKGSSSTKSKHFQASRPPPGFVSYQIPNGVTPPPIPSDNISSYDPRSRYSTSALSLSAGHRGQRSKSDLTSSSSKQRSQSKTELTSRNKQPTAGVHPQHLHNGGRPYKSSVKPSPVVIQNPVYSRTSDSPAILPPSDHHHHHPSPPGYDPPPPPPSHWVDVTVVNDDITYNTTPRSSHKFTGEGGKKYRKSPVPVLRSPVWVQDVDDIDQESVRTLSSGSPEYYNNGKPPLPPICDSDEPKAPPRSRPKSWTSTLFNAFRNGTSKSNSNGASAPMSRERDMSTVTLSSVNTTNTMEKKSYRFSKQVRFLANPSKRSFANQKFYSLPHFAKPVPAPGPVSDGSTTEPEKAVKVRSRTPSPFGRFVKSFVKGNRGNPGKCVSLNILAHLDNNMNFKIELTIASPLRPELA